MSACDALGGALRRLGLPANGAHLIELAEALAALVGRQSERRVLQDALDELTVLAGAARALLRELMIAQGDFDVEAAPGADAHRKPRKPSLSLEFLKSLLSGDLSTAVSRLRPFLEDLPQDTCVAAGSFLHISFDLPVVLDVGVLSRAATTESLPEAVRRTRFVVADEQFHLLGAFPNGGGNLPLQAIFGRVLGVLPRSSRSRLEREFSGALDAAAANRWVERDVASELHSLLVPLQPIFLEAERAVRTTRAWAVPDWKRAQIWLPSCLELLSSLSMPARGDVLYAVRFYGSVRRGIGVAYRATTRGESISWDQRARLAELAIYDLGQVVTSGFGPAVRDDDCRIETWESHCALPPISLDSSGATRQRLLRQRTYCRCSVCRDFDVAFADLWRDRSVEDSLQKIRDAGIVLRRRIAQR
jgi:hypothetical protein